MLYVTSFCMQHCTVVRFVLKQWFVYDCTYFVAKMYNVVCYWKTAVFVLWINKFKCGLKTSVSLVLARLRIIPYLSSGIVERAKRKRAWKSPYARKGDMRRGEKKMIFFIFLSPGRVSPFLAYGDFLARSRFARSTIPADKWGTTRSLGFSYWTL